MSLPNEDAVQTVPATPLMYSSIRAIGTLRPKFSPQQGRIFVEELNVIGTAFWLREYKCLITCAHVIQPLIGAPIELAGLLVVGNANNYRKATIDVIDFQHDLAILRLLDDNNKPLPGTALDSDVNAGLEVVTYYPTVSTSVAYAGFPLGNQLLNQVHSPTYAEGVVGVQRRENLLKKEIQISGPVVGGFSGSPVVLKDTNKVIGVIHGGPQNSTNIFMAISWEHIKAIGQLPNS